MKYENRSEAVDICNQIFKKEKFISDLDSPQVNLRIFTDHSYLANHIISVGINSTEHDFSEFAKVFWMSVRQKLVDEVLQLKAKLEEL